MMAGMGVMIEGQEGLNWERWRRLCAQVEKLGFDSLWRSDHFYSVLGVEGRDSLETWVSLALAAEWTERVEFGPLVASMTFRQPELLARMAAAVDQLAGGRLVLGLGAGWYEEEHARFSIPFPPVRERMDNLEQGIRRIRQTWQRSLPAPARDPIPILIGGSGERRTLRIVAEHADEWNCYGLSVDAYIAKTHVLEDHCREVGRDPREIKRSLMTSFLVGRDGDDLRRRASQIAEMNPNFSGLAPAEVVDRAAERWLVGTPEAIARRMQEYLDAGVQRFMFQHYLMDDEAGLELLAEAGRILD
jgi:alkanesulfonate monooxygenase SsuD/methylene tetrahydromethanopterin reductase-like flavin-dependent oxidoreductase (luciferase family)